jgi:hypothetical protein
MEVLINQQGVVVDKLNLSQGHTYSVTVCPDHSYLMLVRSRHFPAIEDKQVCLYYGLAHHWKVAEIFQTISANEGFIPEHADLLKRVLNWATIDLMRIAYKHDSPPKVGYQI